MKVTKSDPDFEVAKPSEGGSELLSGAAAAAGGGGSEVSITKLKLFYFLYWFGLGAYLPYMPLYLQSIGLSTAQIGVVSCLRPACSTIGSPLWAALADWRKTHQAIALGAIVLSTILKVGVPFLNGVGALYVTLIAAEFIGSPIISLVDAYSVSVLEASGLPLTDYGRIRLWGAVSYGWFAAPLTGWLVEKHGLNVLFVIFSCASIASFFSASSLDLSILGGRSSVVPKGDNDIKTRVQNILRRADVQFVLLAYLILGCSLGIVEGFLFLWLEQLGAPETLMGFSLTFTCLSEVPIFFVAGNIMEYLGFFPCLHVIFVCYVFRLFFYAALPGIPLSYILPVQLVHGITYGLCWATGTAYISTLSEPDIRSSLQGIFSAIFGGAGGTLGLLMGGIIFDRYGGAVLFRLQGTMVLVLMFIVLLYQHFLSPEINLSRPFKMRSTKTLEGDAVDSAR